MPRLWSDACGPWTRGGRALGAGLFAILSASILLARHVKRLQDAAVLGLPFGGFSILLFLACLSASHDANRLRRGEWCPPRGGRLVIPGEVPFDFHTIFIGIPAFLFLGMWILLGVRGYLEVTRRLAPMRRATANLRAALQHARDALPMSAELITLRDEAEELERVADLLDAEARHGLDYQIARRSEEQARTGPSMAEATHRLNSLVALFFPIATLSAVFGINLRHGLEIFDTNPTPIPFLSVLVAGLLIGFLLRAFVTRDDAAVD